MKTLLIKPESWWSQPGCGCCDAAEMPYYDVYLQGERVDLLWTPLDKEQAMQSFLETLGYEVQYEDGEL